MEATSQVAATANAEIGASVMADESVLGVRGMQTVKLSGGRSVEEAIALYTKNPAVEYAQPDYIYYISDPADLKVSVPLNTGAISYREQMQNTIQKVSSRPIPNTNPLQPVTGQKTLTTPIASTGNETLGFMHLSPEKKQEIAEQVRQEVPLANVATVVPQGSANLLQYLKYTPSERNQGYCGNCWVWASTGAVEIAHTVNNGVKDRLSIQYFNSNYNGGTGSYWACSGGWDSYFTSFHNTAPYKQMVPWANLRADYVDGTCNGCSATTRPPAQITTEPNYPVQSMGKSVISTSGVTQTQAIANIKAQINQNKAVWWAFFMPNSSSWSDFSSFWWSQSETALWNPDPYNNIAYTTSGGGHAVLIVGYDDSSANPDEWYWIVLNSWGTTSQRPGGLFRVKMKMDYHGVDTNGYDNHYFSVFNVVFTAGLGLNSQVAVQSTPAGASIYLDNVQQQPVTPGELVTTAGSHTIRLTKAGYNDSIQTITTTEGQTTSVNVPMTVVGSGTITNPNDPMYSLLWGLNNYGQTGGTPDADIDAPEAWAVTSGSPSVIVAVVDTGVDYTHPDLAGNCVAGYNAITKTTNPMDDHGHGTHCAGTIAAVGNNGIGVIGVAPSTKIMPLKFLSASGSGSTSDAINAFNWGYAHGARIFSNSWGGYGTDTALRDAINAYPDAIFICAAGNSGVSTDSYPQSPSALPNANIIAVAASDHMDRLVTNSNWGWGSNYGATTVDVAAPGQSIYSTIPGSRYGYKSGTSMATPHVAGIAGLLKAVNPSATTADLKTAIMNGVNAKSGLSGKCVTGGRVNVYSALQYLAPLEAKFYGVPSLTIQPLTIQFFDVSEGIVSSRTWNFGDGNTSTAQNPGHTFYNPGTYTVTLAVNNGLSMNVASMEVGS